jgi:homoserine dehydrogenase
VLAFESIVNGTTNYVISLMEGGMDYSAALAQAQAEGIAEKNPEYDVKGIDTAIKTVMLTNILLDAEYSLDDIDIKGIDGLSLADIQKAAETGARYKLIGRSVLSCGKARMTVAPEAVKSDHLLHNISGKFKAVDFLTDTFGHIIVSGASSLDGAAGAILRDVVNIIRG